MNDNYIENSLNVILPILTLIIGFCLSWIRDNWSKKRDKQKLKIIILKELELNYEKVNKVIHENLRSGKVPRGFLIDYLYYYKFSTLIYENQIEKLPILNKTFLFDLVDFYHTVFRANEFILEYINDSKNNNNSSMDQSRQVVINSLFEIDDSLANILEKHYNNKGREIIEKNKRDRGIITQGATEYLYGK